MSKAKILVAEDERDTRELIAFTLEMMAGYETVVARDGTEALNLAQVEHPDLILLDVRMPRLDGYEVCARLKENRRTQDIPVVFVSAKGQESEIARGLSVGANDYILKPLDPRRLVGIIERILRARPSEKQRVEELLAELLFAARWTVLLAKSGDYEHSMGVVGTVEGFLERETGVRCDSVGWWGEGELVLILNSELTDETYSSLRKHIAWLCSAEIGIVRGDKTGSFDGVEEIIATARENLRRTG